jgi:hypothetical protein
MIAALGTLEASSEDATESTEVKKRIREHKCVFSSMFKIMNVL